MAFGLGLLLLCTAVLPIVAVYAIKRVRIWYLMSKFTGQLPLPIVGTTYILKNDPRELFIQLREISDEYREKTGGLLRAWLGPIPALTVYGAKHMEVILSSSRHLNKGFVYSFIEPWLGKGLLISSGDKWFTRRKQLTPTFHFSILRRFIEVFNEQSSTLVNKLEKFADKPEPVNIFPFITRCVLDIICNTAMGKHINAQEDYDNEYVKSVLRMSEVIAYRGRKPLLWPDFIFDLTKDGRDHAKCLKILHDVTNSMIREKLQNPQKNVTSDIMDDDVYGRQRIAFLDLLLQIHREDKSLTLENIREEVDTFMFEGHDTTASAISWAIYQIGRHPEVQTRLHEEIDQVFGNSSREVTTEDLPKLFYLNCVVKESLRIIPSVPVVFRTLEEDIMLDGKLVPKEATIIIDINNLHQDPEQFPDPDRFDPDRFLPENIAKRHPFAYVPFSAGPRNCIGQKFALMEDKVVLVNLLRKFSFESVQTIDEVKPAGQLIVRPAEGKMLVKVKSRK